MIIIIMIIMDIVNIYHDDNRDNFDDIAATSQKKTVLKRKKGKHREVFDEGINLCCQTQTYDWSHLLSKVRGNRYSPSWKGRSWWYSSGFRGFAPIIIIIIIITVIIGIGITITITIGPGGIVLDSGSLSPGGGFPCPHSLLDEQDAEVVFFLPKQKNANLSTFVFFTIKDVSQVRIRVQGPTPQSSMQSM